MAKTKTINPIDAFAGARLSVRRKLLGITQDALGKSLNPPKTAQQIQKYESGFNRMGFSVVYQFTKILNITFDYFTDGLEKHLVDQNIDISKPAISDTSAALLETPQTTKLVRHFAEIPSETMRNSILILTQNTAKEFQNLEGGTDDKE